MEELNPVLYILMRTDLASMNPGKAMAQASHASNHFIACSAGFSDELKFLVTAWDGGRGFGTVYVLGVNERQMRSAIDTANLFDIPAGIVHDPTYPLIDGDTLHYIPLDTCAWVFGEKLDPRVVLTVGDFSLHS